MEQIRCHGGCGRFVPANNPCNNTCCTFCNGGFLHTSDCNENANEEKNREILESLDKKLLSLFKFDFEILAFKLRYQQHDEHSQRKYTSLKQIIKVTITKTNPYDPCYTTSCASLHSIHSYGSCGSSSCDSNEYKIDCNDIKDDNDQSNKDIIKDDKDLEALNDWPISKVVFYRLWRGFEENNNTFLIHRLKYALDINDALQYIKEFEYKDIYMLDYLIASTAVDDNTDDSDDEYLLSDDESNISDHQITHNSQNVHNIDDQSNISTNLYNFDGISNETIEEIKKAIARIPQIVQTKIKAIETGVIEAWLTQTNPDSVQTSQLTTNETDGNAINSNNNNNNCTNPINSTNNTNNNITNITNTPLTNSLDLSYESSTSDNEVISDINELKYDSNEPISPNNSYSSLRPIRGGIQGTMSPNGSYYNLQCNINSPRSIASPRSGINDELDDMTYNHDNTSIVTTYQQRNGLSIDSFGNKPLRSRMRYYNHSQRINYLEYPSICNKFDYNNFNDLSMLCIKNDKYMPFSLEFFNQYPLSDIDTENSLILSLVSNDTQFERENIIFDKFQLWLQSQTNVENCDNIIKYRICDDYSEYVQARNNENKSVLSDTNDSFESIPIKKAKIRHLKCDLANLYDFVYHERVFWNKMKRLPIKRDKYDDDEEEGIENNTNNTTNKNLNINKEINTNVRNDTVFYSVWYETEWARIKIPILKAVLGAFESLIKRSEGIGNGSTSQLLGEDIDIVDDIEDVQDMDGVDDMNDIEMSLVEMEWKWGFDLNIIEVITDYLAVPPTYDDLKERRIKFWQDQCNLLVDKYGKEMIDEIKVCGKMEFAN